MTFKKQFPMISSYLPGSPVFSSFVIDVKYERYNIFMSL